MKKLPHLVARCLVPVTAWALALAAAYILTKLLFQLTGRPPELIIVVISGLVAALLIMAGMKIFPRLQRDGNKRRFPRQNLLTDTLEAMERIAQGDFNISVVIGDARDPFNELAASVNKMAKELGSMEKLRQDFISNVSHEIQSPLTSISGYASLLQKGGVNQEQIEHYAGIIETESKRLSKLSSNLLKLSALEADNLSLETKPFRLDKQIENILLMMEPQWAAKRISPEVDLTRITLNGNEDLLSQVWINLLHNAIKFTPEGGWIRMTLTGNSENTTCTVSDSGIGISPEDQIHIFERFYRADKARDRSLGGNGLGLSLVKKIIELHGGRVTVKSEPGKGSSFTVTLPMESERRISADL